MSQLELFNYSSLICHKCGELSPNNYVHELNHGQMDNSGMCTSQSLVSNQLAYEAKTGTLTTKRVQYGRDLRLNVDKIIHAAQQPDRNNK